MASGGIQQNFLEAEGITPHEDRTLRWVVKDGDDANVTDMSGWSVVFYWLPKGTRSTTDGPTALDAADTFKKTASLSAPNADVAIDAADWATYSLSAQRYEYELWRTDTGNQRRLAYGDIQVIG